MALYEEILLLAKKLVNEKKEGLHKDDAIFLLASKTISEENAIGGYIIPSFDDLDLIADSLIALAKTQNRTALYQLMRLLLTVCAADDESRKILKEAIIGIDSEIDLIETKEKNIVN